MENIGRGAWPCASTKNQRYFHKSIRLKGYDYTRPGSYFITLCTGHHQALFGDIIDGEMILNEWGRIIKDYIDKIPDHYANVEIDRYVIMPNHVHMIVVLWLEKESCNGTANQINVEAIHELPLRDRMKTRRKMKLPKIVGWLKMNASKQINIKRKISVQSIWQRNYYEHIIRNERELNNIRRYIINNPPNWEYDRENRNGIPIDEKKKFWLRFYNEYE